MVRKNTVRGTWIEEWRLHEEWLTSGVGKEKTVVINRERDMFSVHETSLLAISNIIGGKTIEVKNRN